jgi:hypothetical protein
MDYFENSTDILQILLFLVSGLFCYFVHSKNNQRKSADYFFPCISCILRLIKIESYGQVYLLKDLFFRLGTVK